MIQRLLALFVFVLTLSAHGQILTPTKFSHTAPKQVTIGQEIELVFTAKIEKTWYLYSTEFPCEDGPLKTAFTFEPNDSYRLVGGIVPVKPVDKYDEIFECNVKIFKGTGEFRQKVKVLAANLKIAGNIEFQTCTEVNGQCVPGEHDFIFDGFTVSGQAPKPKTEEKKPDAESPVPAADDTTSTKPSQPRFTAKIEGPRLDPTILEGQSEVEQESFWAYLVFAFVLGLTSLITPCVFPMIPMTVTFFLKDDQSRAAGIRKALVFGFSIVAIYTLAGTLFAVLLGADGLNALATHWAPNLFVFVIFIVFALSFLGLFEINAPHQLVNKVDQQAEKGGWGGIFFMAATLVLVSFSCTIPIVGNVVVMAAGGQVIKPVLAMLFYSLAFALPFTLFAIFPEWIKSLPKSGGWLNTVKVTLGFLELALCLKFFSIADQAYHWGLLDREVNIAIWIVLFALLGFYILGKIRMPSDTPVERVTVPRLLIAAFIFSFVLYLIPGMWGAPLKALAGYLPPQNTLDFDLVAMTRAQQEKDMCEEPRFSDFLHLPHGLQGYFDYQQALACARDQRKPLFIDFTGHGCTNCREMEAVVWSDPQVLQRLQNDFVLVALYVDDKTQLPESEWYTSSYDNKVKKTIGKQNADLQIRNLENNAQPFYVLVGADERVLAWPYGYDRSVEEFVAFLERGKKKYKELYP